MAVTLQDCEPLLIDQVLRGIVQDLKSAISRQRPQGQMLTRVSPLGWPNHVTMTSKRNAMGRVVFFAGA